MVMIIWFAWVIWREFFLKNILQKATQRPTKVHFFPYKQVRKRNGDHEWLRMTNAFILCDFVWNVQKSHAANRKGSFKYSIHTTRETYIVYWCKMVGLPYIANSQIYVGYLLQAILTGQRLSHDSVLQNICFILSCHMFRLTWTSLPNLIKGPSIIVNIFTSVQTVCYVEEVTPDVRFWWEINVDMQSFLSVFKASLYPY